MPSPQKFRTVGIAAEDTVFAAHIQSPPGTDPTQSTISGITYTVKQSIGPQQGVTTGSGTPAVNPTISNALVSPLTDPSWTQDNSGYNFKYTIAGAQIPDAGDYVITFLITPTGGGTAFALIFFHHANSTS